MIDYTELDKIHCVDALELLRAQADSSIDALITDMPYGQTANIWDKRPDLEAFWCEAKRIVQPQGVIVCTAMQPFTSLLVVSNIEWFRYEWIYEKTRATDFLNAKHRPIRIHENVLVFAPGRTTAGANGGKERANYYPQMTQGEPYAKLQRATSRNYNLKQRIPTNNVDGLRFPKTILRFDNTMGGKGAVHHPTEKPLSLMEYIVRAYTAIGHVVLDPFMGSGTTLVAAQKLERRFIGGDSNAEYVTIAQKRLNLPYMLQMFDAGD